VGGLLLLLPLLPLLDEPPSVQSSPPMVKPPCPSGDQLIVPPSSLVTVPSHEKLEPSPTTAHAPFDAAPSTTGTDAVCPWTVIEQVYALPQ
jgi:hypothetical protein